MAECGSSRLLGRSNQWRLSWDGHPRAAGAVSSTRTRFRYAQLGQGRGVPQAPGWLSSVGIYLATAGALSLAGLAAAKPAREEVAIDEAKAQMIMPMVLG